MPQDTSGRTLKRARTLSGLERVWLVADQLDPPFVNQLVLESEGPADFDCAAWTEALLQVSTRWPGARLRLRGRLRNSHWAVADEPPPVTLVDGSAWGGDGPEGAPFLLRPLDPRKGPTVELLLVEGPTARMILRSHHACLDGRATLRLAHDLFAVRMGLKIAPVPAGPDFDEALARRAGGRRVPEPAASRGAPTGLCTAEKGTTWHRGQLKGRSPRLLPRVLVALGQVAAQSSPLPQRVSISVDLRRFEESEHPAANLAGVVRLELARILLQKDPVDAAATALTRALVEDGGRGTPIAAGPLRNVPLWLMAREGRKAAGHSAKHNRWPVSATISNMGVQSVEPLLAPDFRTARSFWIPPASPGLPLFLTLTGGPTGVEFCGAGPVSLCGEGRLEDLLHKIIAQLEKDTAVAVKQLPT